MPINKETIISVFDDKLTLMQWLKTINKALEDAVLTGVEITKKGNATLSFKFTFEDGTFLETNDLVLQQGESVVNAFIQNGHLYLTLSNGNNLDAGNVKPVSNFSIDANQHLIVNYGDGTSQDLGAIFNGDVNINGNFTANSIIENMTGYFANLNVASNIDLEAIYAGICKNGNKVTFVVAVNITKHAGGQAEPSLIDFEVPQNVFNRIYPTAIGNLTGAVDVRSVLAFSNEWQYIEVPVETFKTNTRLRTYIKTSNMVEETKYYFRYEFTLLLSENLIGA